MELVAPHHGARPHVIRLGPRNPHRGTGDQRRRPRCGVTAPPLRHRDTQQRRPRVHGNGDSASWNSGRSSPRTRTPKRNRIADSARICQRRSRRPTPPPCAGRRPARGAGGGDPGEGEATVERLCRGTLKPPPRVGVHPAAPALRCARRPRGRPAGRSGRGDCHLGPGNSPSCRPGEAAVGLTPRGFSLVLDAQRASEPVGWLTAEESAVFPSRRQGPCRPCRPRRPTAGGRAAPPGGRDPACSDASASSCSTSARPPGCRAPCRCACSAWPGSGLAASGVFTCTSGCARGKAGG